MTPTDPNIIKAIKSIQKANDKLLKLRSLCEHNYIQINWYDSWNGWDYPTTSVGITTYKCSKCCDVITKESAIKHGT
jgi:hypothetical protein